MGDAQLGERIKLAREEADLTQAELASRIGLSQGQSISNYERGVKEVPPRRLRAIAAETKKPLSFFLPDSANGQAEGGDALERLVSRLDAIERSQSQNGELLAELLRIVREG